MLATSLWSNPKRAPYCRLSVWRTRPLRLPGRVGTLMVVALFAGLDFHVQIVLRRWQRTGGKGSEGTRRILGFVEIKHRLPIHWLISMEKSSRAVGLVQVRLIAEDDKQGPVFFPDRLKRILFSFKGKLQNPWALHLKMSAEDIR